MKAIAWLYEPGCDDASLVGGKAAHLARLQAVHPVPPGFCVTAQVHDRWAPGAGEGFPEELAGLVRAAYAKLGERCDVAEPVVAVRSSAIDEDSAGASFAGIYITCLNVRGLDHVLRAIQRCWASASDPRVLAYRQRKNLPGAGVGVLVQSLVAADVAAVVFSANPTTGAPDEIIINANWGLGESIVGGLATPDTWILRKSDLSTVRVTTGAKEQMTVLGEEGTREVPVLRTLRARLCLDNAQVLELARLAVRLEAQMTWPVDIECAFEAGRLSLLQCRPITTGKRG
jgi:pyruvate, water dikinase